VLVQVNVNVPLIRVKLLQAINRNLDPYLYSYLCLCERSLTVCNETQSDLEVNVVLDLLDKVLHFTHYELTLLQCRTQL